MGLMDRWHASREERARRRQQSAYDRAVDHWIAVAGNLSNRMDQLRGATTGSASGVLLQADECLIDVLEGIALVAPKSTRVTNFVGGSYQLTERTRVRSGQYRSTTEEQQTPIDTGRLVVTDRKVVFAGSRRTVDWEWRRLVGVTNSGSTTILHVSNRVRAHGISCPAHLVERVLESLDVAWALYSDRGEELRAEYERQLEARLAAPPQTPEGIPTDPRVQRIAAPTSARDTVAALLEDMRKIAQASQARFGFTVTPIEIVERAIRATNYLPVRVLPEAISDAASFRSTSSHAAREAGAKGWIPLISDDHDVVAWALHELAGAPAVAICGSAELLDEFGISPADAERHTPAEMHLGVDEAESASQRLTDAGNNVTSLRVSDSTVPHETAAVIDAAARTARSARQQPQALVVTGNPKVASLLQGLAHGFDVIAWCVGEAPDLASADGEVTDDITDTLDLDGDPGPNLRVAGNSIPDSTSVVIAYLAEHGGTVATYDLAAGSFDSITTDLIRRTRRPWMNSRISRDEESWLCDRAASAPWESVPPDARLTDADPTEPGGLYDAALVLYNHFAASAPKGIGRAKVHKCLHLMRPHLYPILDSRLAALYDSAARRAAREVAASRPEFARWKRLYWAAIRTDLVQQPEALAELRRRLTASQSPLVVEVADRVPDLRLLDMCAWSEASINEDVD